METKYYKLTEAAELSGIAPITLKQLLLSAKVDKVMRDRNNWRRFTDSDVRRIKALADKITAPTRKRK